jgi:hypothetical protein
LPAAHQKPKITSQKIAGDWGGGRWTRLVTGLGGALWAKLNIIPLQAELVFHVLGSKMFLSFFLSFLNQGVVVFLFKKMG